jgi:uncharacterized lipoprotein YmbA
MNSPLFPRRGAAFALAAATCLLITACASAPDIPPTLLTLPGAAAAPAAPAAGEGRTLVVARLDIPEYLVSRRVRYRTDSSTLAEWPHTFWAERIEVGMSREFGAALRARLPGWRLCEAQCAEWAPVATLRVVVDRLDYSRPDRRLTASARILVAPTATATAAAPTAPRASGLLRRDYALTAGADTPQAQAQAYAELLDRLAADAVGALQTF